MTTVLTVAVVALALICVLVCIDLYGKVAWLNHKMDEVQLRQHRKNLAISDILREVVRKIWGGPDSP